MLKICKLSLWQSSQKNYPEAVVEFRHYRPKADSHILNYLVRCLINSQGLLLLILVRTSIKI
jgi:hypothetical protein